MNVIEAIHGRRSIRAYTARAVDEDIIESIIWDAAQAPPPFRGEVPWVFNVVKGAERIAEFGSRALEHAKAHYRAQGNVTSWFERPGVKVFWDAPVVVIISGSVQDCCRAGQNLMLSAHARGLGTCWVGSPMLWLKTEEVKSELRIPHEVEPVAAICLGYPAEDPDAPARERPPIVWVG
jgi:nitroreductase